jgi:hypothetical protein
MLVISSSNCFPLASNRPQLLMKFYWSLSVLPPGWTTSRRKLVKSWFLTRRCASSISYIGKTVGLSYSDSAPFQRHLPPVKHRWTFALPALKIHSSMTQGWEWGRGEGVPSAGCTLRRVVLNISRNLWQRDAEARYRVPRARDSCHLSELRLSGFPDNENTLYENYFA